MKRCRLVVALSLIAVTSVAACKAEPQSAEVVLFNGKDLTGWTVTECETEIKDGVLLLKKGEGWVRTDHQYTDFVLSWECRNLQAKGYDSGVHFRAELPAAGAHWPKKFQVNLKEGQEGNLTSIKSAASTGLYKPGDWNAFVLTVVGNTAELVINGKPAWKTDGIDAATGYIGLQSEPTIGGQFEFRNIKIKELGKKTAFNGRDFEGWEGAGQAASKCWKVEDGLLICTGEKGPWLRSLEQYDDFNLRLEYLLRAGGNSGVFVRVPEDGNHHGKDSGLEIQLLDDADPQYAKLKPYQYSAGVYDIVGPKPRISRPAGTWNTIEINCQKNHYRITHNGVVVIDADEKQFPLLKERRLSGYIGLQNHSERVAFRNIRIGPAM